MKMIRTNESDCGDILHGAVVSFFRISEAGLDENDAAVNKGPGAPGRARPPSSQPAAHARTHRRQASHARTQTHTRRCLRRRTNSTSRPTYVPILRTSNSVCLSAGPAYIKDYARNILYERCRGKYAMKVRTLRLPPVAAISLPPSPNGQTQMRASITSTEPLASRTALT